MFTINHSNGRTETHETLQGAIAALRADHPECVAYFADGAVVKLTHTEIHPNTGARVLVWATEEDSADDDGARAIASITGEPAPTITIDHADPFAGLVAPEEQGEVLAGWLREKSAHVLAVELLSSASAAGCGTWDDATLRALTKALEKHAETWA